MAWDVTSWFINEAGTKAPTIVRKLNAAYLKDTTANEYDAVGFGSPIFIAGTVAPQAIQFDGEDDYFSIIGKSYQVSSHALPLTIEARIAVASADVSPQGDADNTIILSWDRSEYFRFGIGSQVNSSFKTSFNFTPLGATTDYNGATDVADGTYKTLTVRYDPNTNGGQLKFFIDGASDSIVNSVGTWWGSTGDLRRYGYIGGNSEADVFGGNPSGGAKYKGKIEFIRLWEVARTDSEISSHYNTVSLDTTSGLSINYNMEGMGDISERVVRWPTFRRHWSDIRPQVARLTLANEDGYFNEFWKRPQAGLTTFAVQFGFTHPTSGDELITPFVGRLGTAHHQRGMLSLTIDDKVSQLSDVAIGTNESPVTYTDSTLPSDMVWDWLTNIGPYSSVQSTSNPDIDYASFQEWAGVFSSDSIVINGSFEGQKITEALRKMARYTQSAIYMEGGLMRFSRFTAVNTETTFLTADDVTDTSVSVQMNRLVTKQIVLAGYSVDSDDWSIEATHIDSANSVSYGLRENIERDENIWYTTSVSAVNLAQRFTLIGGNPYEDINTVATLKAIPRQVGETLNFTDQQTDISKGYRIMEMEFDMSTGLFNLNINASQTETPFILDSSLLDSADKLL